MGMIEEYRMYDGTIIGGNSFGELVESMASFKLSRPQDHEHYRKATAKRVKDVYDIDIDCSSDERFIKSLQEAELVTKIT